MKEYSHKGLTLLELLIAMSIIGIIATFSFSSFHNLLEKQRLKSAGETIFSDLRSAQSESIKRNKKVYVSFNRHTDGWCYGTSVGNPCNCNDSTQCSASKILKVVSYEKFKGIDLQKAKFAGNKNYTAFDPIKGFAFADGVKNGSIWLKSQNGTQLAVIVNRLGRVRFCSPSMSEYSNQCPTNPN